MSNVDMAELIRCARIPLELNVKPGEEILILADTTTEDDLPKAMAAAARQVGAEPSVLIMETRPAPNVEPSRAAAGAMRSVDVLVMMASQPMTHTEALRAALGAGVKYIAMPMLTISSLTQGAATADPHELFAVTEKVAALLTEASTARVVSEQGTDVTMDLRGRNGIILGGLCIPGKTTGGFPHGESPIAPVEDATTGTVVFDTTMNPVGRLSRPVVLQVERGRITKIEGGPEAAKLRDLLASKGDENSYMIGEFAIGTNPKARITGNMSEDKRKRGTVHFGIGDNATLGGKVRAAIHLDGLILRPTVTLDGRVVVENGELKL